MNSISLEEGCEKLKDLNLRTDPAAQEIFCRVAIEYAHHELSSQGIDLLSIASLEEVSSFCKLWLSHQPVKDNDLALIGVAYAIQLRAQGILKWKRHSSS
jgi:hypothetical protein